MTRMRLIRAYVQIILYASAHTGRKGWPAANALLVPERAAAALVDTGAAVLRDDPLAYVKYGKPQFTTFSNASAACQACITYYPLKEDGGRFNSPMHQATDKETGGDPTEWLRKCRAGPCDFRDPQTQPEGGIIGMGPDFGKPDGKTCLTRDPVMWYSDCEEVLQKSSSSVLDVTRYCSYKHQIFFPPPAGLPTNFADVDTAFTRFGRSKEQCTATIAKQGQALFGEVNACDTDLEALSGCCESVYGVMTCVQEGAGGILAAEELSSTMEVFEKYCVPLCKYTEEEFCTKFPHSDVCVKHESCETCTASGGLWCPKLMSCHCPGPDPPPCMLAPKSLPTECSVAKFKKFLPKDAVAVTPESSAQASVQQQAAGTTGLERPGKICKYEEMARNWGKDKI
mmetsp:Transcript_12560/g.23516  ORF Transcript_12560/g.23516 Transcript_12560/m.23516 type:complete len:398 (+) Transcript_12560:34-1227(+)